MADWLNSVSDIVSLAANSKAIIGGVGGLALISAAALPRVGLRRAISLGWRSYFKTTSPLSVRKLEIQQLTESITMMEKGSYITVIGGKGNGKSCLIDTTLNGHFGVVKLSVSRHLLCIILDYDFNLFIVCVIIYSFGIARLNLALPNQ
jgi:hypothetical protein